MDDALVPEGSEAVDEGDSAFAEATPSVRRVRRSPAQIADGRCGKRYPFEGADLAVVPRDRPKGCLHDR